MSLHATQDSRRGDAERLAYVARRFPNASVADELAELAPPAMTPAARADALARLIDAITLRDAVALVAARPSHRIADAIRWINPRQLPETARPAYTALIVAARIRKAIVTKERAVLIGIDRVLDEALEHARAAVAFEQELLNGDFTVHEADSDSADAGYLADRADDDVREAQARVKAALGDLSFRTQHRLDTALTTLKDAAEQQVEAALTRLIGAAR